MDQPSTSGFEPYQIIGGVHKALRTCCDPEVKFDQDELKNIFEGMEQSIVLSGGFGLSANQVGINKRLFVIIDSAQNARYYINPVLLGMSKETETAVEGCLSSLDLTFEVERPHKIKVAFQSIDGEHYEQEMSGMFARVFLHELDHLNGIRFVDRVGSMKRRLAREKFLTSNPGAGKVLAESMNLYPQPLSPYKGYT